MWIRTHAVSVDRPHGFWSRAALLHPFFILMQIKHTALQSRHEAHGGRKMLGKNGCGAGEGCVGPVSGLS